MSGISNTSHMAFCPVGRKLDLAHAVCISCQRQGLVCPERSKKRSRKAAAPVRWWSCGCVFVTTKYLYSMNHWHGRPRHVYTRYRKEWEAVLTGTWALWGKAAGRRRLVVTRYVAGKKEIIEDDTNLHGALKPIEDILVRSGVLVDDCRDLLDAEIRQFIDRENPRTEIEVTVCVA